METKVTNGLARDQSLGLEYRLVRVAKALFKGMRKVEKVGMYLTPVGTICSMPADGRFSARPAGV
jgi:hypothetical protein